MTHGITRVKKKFNANKPIRPSLTAELVQKIMDLPADGRKSDYLKEVLLSKYCSVDTASPLERRTRAITKWLETELRNEATNVKLLNVCGDYQILPHIEFDTFVEFAQGLVTKIVGDTVPEESLIGNFSSGASTSRRRTESHPASKFLGQADVTPRAKEVFDLIIEDSPESGPALLPGWGSYKEELTLNLVKGNVLFTVPKNAEIDRVSCKEPDVNMFLQKGLGNQIRKALLREGINLNDQSINQRLARRGSRDGSLATLDLRSASDSVSTELVSLLMPPLWFTMLDAVRSPVTFVDGVEHCNEMFSSMGNGFTFELESLLFYVLARSTAYFRGVSGVISVYGDDIICPSALAHDLIHVLSFFGFEVNTEKSFWEGDFRESCGGHYVDGRDITPFYLRAPIQRLTDLIHIGNALRKWSESEDGLGINDPYVYDVWAWIRDQVPKGLWGGREYSSSLQLVTPHGARGKLVASKDDKFFDYSDARGYLHWLASTWMRSPSCLTEPGFVRELYSGGGDVSTSFVTKEFGWYRVRPAKGIVTQLRHVFYQEIVFTPSTDDNVLTVVDNP